MVFCTWCVFYNLNAFWGTLWILTVMKKNACVSAWGLFFFFCRWAERYKWEILGQHLKKSPHFVSKILLASGRAVQRDLLSYECLGSMVKPVNINNHNESMWEENIKMCQTYIFSLKVRLWYQLCHDDTAKSLPLWHKEESHWLWAGSPPPFPAPDVRTVPPRLRECLLQPHDSVVSCNFPAKSKSHSTHTSMKYITSLREQILH